MKKFLLASLLLAACTTEENLALTAPPYGPESVGGTRWAVRLGGPGEDTLVAIAVDSLDDVIAAGRTTSNPIDFGSGPVMVTRASGNHSYITKRGASDGVEHWTRNLVTVASNSGVDLRAIAVAPDDDVIAVGSWNGSVDFGGQTAVAPAFPDAGREFVARYAPDGQLRWVHSLDPSLSIQPLKIAISPGGQIFVAGIGTSTPSPSTFVARLDAEGAPIWVNVFPSASATESVVPTDLAITPSGEVLVTGSFQGTTTFGGPALSARSPIGSIFLARMTADGLYSSSKVLGPTVANVGANFAFLTFRGDQTIVQYATSGTAKVEALDSAWNTEWSTSVSNDATEPVRALVTTMNGTLVSAAFMNSQGGLDPTTHHGNLEVVTYDTADQKGVATLWSTTQGSAGVMYGALSPTGSLVFGGEFSGMGDFGGVPLATSGFQDFDVMLIVAAPAD